MIQSLQEILKGTYQRRFENRAMRPYFSVAICYAYNRLLPEWLGFGYNKMISLVSPDMMNATYFDVDEMQQATEHFAKIWKDQKQINEILKRN